MRKSASGFTIVELLIVIVVIAILAAISIVAYAGIQRRATNTQIISSAGQVIKAVSGYIAANGTYPLAVNSHYCVVPDTTTSCASFNASRVTNTTLTNNLKTISALPSSTPIVSVDWTGISYNYDTSITFNGISQPLRILYSLQGTSQQCGLANVSNSGGATMVTSGLGYTANVADPGYTICVISIPGPTV